MITTILFYVSMFFFAAAIACGCDAVRLEKRVSPAWCAVITWCILMGGVFMFGIVLMKG